MFNRLSLSLAAAALLLCFSFGLSSCGLIVINKTTPSDSDDTTSSSQSSGSASSDTTSPSDPDSPDRDYKAEARAAFDALSVTDMSGVRFVIACVDPTFLTGDAGETVLSSDRVSRIALLEEKFNTKLSVKSYTEEDLYTGISASYLSGEYFADLLALPQSRVGVFATDGLLMNLRSVPGFHLDNAAFNQSSIYSLSAGHLVIGLSGEGAFEPEKLNGLYFNRDVAGALGLDDIYDIVKAGAWTLDRYALCVRTASDGEKKTAVYNGDLNLALLLSSGFSFTENGIDKTPTANTFSQSFSDLVALFSALPEQEQTDDAQAAFLAGDTLFYAGSLTDAAALANSSFNWGLIPFPKGDAEAEYSSSASSGAVIFCIPAGTGTGEAGGDFITALCVLSADYIKYDFLKHNMYYVLRDNTSVNNMLTIINGVYYDFSMMISSGYKTLYADTIASFGQLTSGELSYEEYSKRQEEFKDYLKYWFPVLYE